MAWHTAFVFPGQGSQSLGMLERLPATEDLNRLLDAAEALSDIELRAIATLGPESEMADTRVAQPLLYLADWIWARALIERGLTPDVVAGHSLGELAALAVAGVYSVEAGLELVVERSRLMATAAMNVPGTMAAVLGMQRDAIAEAIGAIDGAWVANDNAAGQVVITGTHLGVEAATAALTEAGARRVVELPVAGPFHSPLMADAADAFAALIHGAAFADASVPVIQNTDPAPALDAEVIRERLIGQITAPVRWTETMAVLSAAGPMTVVEAGPGKVLTGLCRRVEGIAAIAADEAGIDAVLEEAR